MVSMFNPRDLTGKRIGKSGKVTLGKNKAKDIHFDNYRVRVETRKSGSLWVIEFSDPAVADSASIVGQTNDAQQQEWFDLVLSQGLRVKQDFVHPRRELNALKKFDIAESLMIVKLGGIGISLVDFNPRELCYISVEGLVMLQELNVYKSGRRQKTFTKVELTVRNIQVDDCLS